MVSLMIDPVRLNVDVDGVHFCAQFDVFFDGKRQTQCLIADSQHGYIKRYKSVMGAIVRRNGRVIVEEAHGKVEIVRRSKPS